MHMEHENFRLSTSISLLKVMSTLSEAFQDRHLDRYGIHHDVNCSDWKSSMNY